RVAAPRALRNRCRRHARRPRRRHRRPSRCRRADAHAERALMDGSRFLEDAVERAPVTRSVAAPPRQLRLGDWVGFIAMVFGMFMALLDIQIVSSSLAEIQAGLAAGADEISWVQTSYLIAEVVMIPLSGFLSRVLATRVLFAVSAASFTAMSLLCAAAWNLDSMIVFRAAQGCLGGAMIPTVF